MSREDDIKKEMERIKASQHYQDYQKEHAPKALAKLEPWKLGTTEDDKHEVWAPIAGPDAAKVLHLKRRVWMCSWCRSTFRFRGSMFRRHVIQHEDGSVEGKSMSCNPAAIVDFDGKVYHRDCYYAMKRAAEAGEEKEMMGNDNPEKLLEQAESCTEPEHEDPREHSPEVETVKEQVREFMRKGLRGTSGDSKREESD